MIDFQPLKLSDKEEYETYLRSIGERGCEYSFVNLYAWGRQRAAVVDGYLALFSQFNRRSVYPFPVGQGDIRPVLDAIIHDAKTRDIPCRITGILAHERVLLEELYPGRFRFHHDRDGYDYVYAIDDLADLKGKKFQKKRNHLHRFRDAHPDYTAVPLTQENLPAAQAMIDGWFADRIREDPQGDYCMERVAIRRALRHWQELGMEGLLLMDGEQVLAVTLGSRLNENTFNVHFEKAQTDAYGAVNQAFARYLREKYPAIRYLNREDDLGLPGLRKAKLSYNPAFLVEKCWAYLAEEAYDD